MDIFWSRYEKRFPFVGQLQQNFAVNLEQSFKEIATDLGIPLDTNFSMDSDGQVRASQLGWLFIGKLFETSVNVTENRMSQKYDKQIHMLNMKIIQVDQMRIELESQMDEVNELSKKIQGIIDNYEKYEAFMKSQAPPE
jgi:hypothetical protein